MNKLQEIEKYGEEGYKQHLLRNKEYSKEYYKRKKEEYFKKKFKEYYAVNKDKLLEYSKKYYQEHKEEYKIRYEKTKKKNEEKE
ncbi:MAG: hypothetical protein MJ245_02910 [Clostridia bacterium]|nr:hypothetical protein [Clostridia bacterium]